MQIRSLFLESEMIFWQFGSIVEDHGDHIVIKTPANPTWRWGNLMLFPHPPQPTDLVRWNELFDHHFDVENEHRLFVWDTIDGDKGAAETFVENGFQFTREPMLGALDLQLPEQHNRQIETHVIRSDQEWESVIQLNVESFAAENLAYQDYVERKFRLYRNMVEAERGFWMGAWLENKLLASCGVFHNGHITRYQEVVTREENRNFGICTKLVFDAFTHGRSLSFPNQTLIAVDLDSQAERIYRRLGFHDLEMTCAVRRSPNEKEKG